MRPYYQDELVTLYHGDSADILPDLPEFDLLLTDPPYGIGEHYGNRSGPKCSSRLAEYLVEGWNEYVPHDVIAAAVEKCRRWMVFGLPYVHVPGSSCLFVWDKCNCCRGQLSTHVGIACGPRESFGIAADWVRASPAEVTSRDGLRVHPTQVPLSVMDGCIGFATKRKTGEAGGPPASILEPFAGSGSSLVAAKAAGIPSTGIEREEQYCEAIVERLRQGVLFA